MQKGQLSIFMIMGLLMLVLIALLISLITEEGGVKDDIIQGFNKESRSAKAYLETCVDSKINEALTVLFSDIDVEVYVETGGVRGVMNGEEINLDNYFSGILKEYEIVIEELVRTSTCLNNIPAGLTNLELNPENIRVEFELGQVLLVKTFLNAEVRTDNSVLKINMIEKNYGSVFVNEFNIVLEKVLDSFSNCMFGLCLPGIAGSIPEGMQLDTFRLRNDYYKMRISHSNAQVNGQEVSLNLRVYL